MHIAFLTPEYPHEKVLHAAGIGTSIKSLVVALVEKGVKVSLFVYGQATSEVFYEEGIKIHLIEKKRYSCCTWFFYRKYIQNYLNNYISKDQIQLVEAPDWTGITAFMNLKAPLIVRFHGSDAYFCHLEGRKQKLKNFWFEKMGIQNATAFIAPTHFAGKLSKEIFSIQHKEIRTIHYGLPVEDFENDTPEVFEEAMILYIGTLIRKKGVLEFPEIMKKVVAENPKAHLVLIGSDSFDIQTQFNSTWALLQKQTDEATIKHITYLGKVPYREVKEYIKRANICVFPTFAETLGMVTIESMAMQKAVVNSSIGWAEELIVDEESGYLVYPSNHDLFTSRIVSLMGDKELVLQIGKNARERVTQIFDIQKTVLQNIEFYKKYHDRYISSK